MIPYKTTVTCGEVPIAVYETGSGPTLVFVHGFVVDHREWQEVALRMSKSFRCVLLDLPGSGNSGRPDPGVYPYTREAFAHTMVDALDKLGYRQFMLAGHSMGGGIALNMAADHPDRIQKLCVVDPEAMQFPLSLKARVPLLPIVGEFIFKRLYGRRLFRDYFENDVYSPNASINFDMIDSYYDFFNSKAGRDANYAILVRSLDFNALTPRLSSIHTPTLLIWGRDDKILPVEHAQELAKLLPNSSLHIIENCGHAANEEQPDQVADWMTRHFQA